MRNKRQEGAAEARERATAADVPIFVISVAAELAGMHPQTLRQYDRLGLVTPSRTRGRGRRYSVADIDALREVQRLSKDEGINLAGIRHIMDLRRELRAARRELARLREEADARRAHRVFAATSSGDVVLVRHGTRLQASDRGARARPGGELIVHPSRTDALVVWNHDRSR
ncbi:MAG: helix-turn-helix transcriptional regulator [Bowdeniella nasicola]|nr:helix-turn-helix transcriptional regulator [Bowdeniella nasicola]